MEKTNPQQAIYNLARPGRHRHGAGLADDGAADHSAHPGGDAGRDAGRLLAGAVRGLQTQHQVVLGGASALDQNTKFNIKIVASGHDWRGGA